MDRAKMLQFLGPALGAAAVVLLVGLLIAMNDAGPAANSAKAPTGDSNSPPPPDNGYKGPQVPFSLEGPEWKDAAGGMKVWDVKEGTGEPCPPGASVTIHYTGWLTNGSKFDSSKDRGAPTTFALSDLVRGWQEGIPGMKPGGIRRLIIPPEWAYGSRGRPGIPPNSTLVFEIELFSHKGG